MNAGDMVYYLHTNQHGNQTQFAARIVAPDEKGFRIRIGKYDVDSREVKTLEAVVAEDTLRPRTVPSSYEDALKGAD